MFNAVYNSKCANSILSGTVLYSNIELEEDYLLSQYPVCEFDFDSYIPTQKCVIKTANISNKLQYYALIHEIYLTLHLTGNVRQVIDVKFTTDYLYVIFSYIIGKSLSSVIESYLFDHITFDDVIAALKLLVSQLQYLYTTYNFTHYDLHLDNVIVSSDSVYIIDLEYAYAHINNRHHGITFSSTDNIEVTPSHYWPYDMYKLLCFIKLYINKVRSLYVKRMQLLQIEYSREYEHAVISGDIVRMFEIEEYIQELDKNFNTRIVLLDNKLSNCELIKYIDDLLSYFIDPQHFTSIKSKYYAAPRVDAPNFDDFIKHFDSINLKWSTSC